MLRGEGHSEDNLRTLENELLAEQGPEGWGSSVTEKYSWLRRREVYLPTVRWVYK